MPAYSLVFKESVAKDLRRLPEAQLGRVLERIEALGQEPFPRQSLKLTGAEHFHRLRVGDYRVIYEVDAEARQITVHVVRHRRDVYR